MLDLISDLGEGSTFEETPRALTKINYTFPRGRGVTIHDGVFRIVPHQDNFNTHAVELLLRKENYRFS